MMMALQYILLELNGRGSTYHPIFVFVERILGEDTSYGRDIHLR